MSRNSGPTEVLLETGTIKSGSKRSRDTDDNSSKKSKQKSAKVELSTCTHSSQDGKTFVSTDMPAATTNTDQSPKKLQPLKHADLHITDAEPSRGVEFPQLRNVEAHVVTTEKGYVQPVPKNKLHSSTIEFLHVNITCFLETVKNFRITSLLMFEYKGWKAPEFLIEFQDKIKILLILSNAPKTLAALEHSQHDMTELAYEIMTITEILSSQTIRLSTQIQLMQSKEIVAATQPCITTEFVTTLLKNSKRLLFLDASRIVNLLEDLVVYTKSMLVRP
jgi:hypothetical protein